MVKANTPTFDYLLSTGLYSLEACIQEAESARSGQGWSSVLRGVDSEKHKIDGNEIESYNKAKTKYKTFLWHAKHTGNRKTAAVVTWSDLYVHLIEASATDYIRSENDSNGVYRLEEIITNLDFDVIFWGNDDVDAWGHATGFHPDITQYIQAIEEKDS